MNIPCKKVCLLDRNLDNDLYHNPYYFVWEKWGIIELILVYFCHSVQKINIKYDSNVINTC